MVIDIFVNQRQDFVAIYLSFSDIAVHSYSIFVHFEVRLLDQYTRKKKNIIHVLGATY